MSIAPTPNEEVRARRERHPIRIERLQKMLEDAETVVQRTTSSPGKDEAERLRARFTDIAQARDQSDEKEAQFQRKHQQELQPQIGSLLKQAETLIEALFKRPLKWPSLTRVVRRPVHRHRWLLRW